jgi:diguanylate cyclase (GGDEF)-like protein
MELESFSSCSRKRAGTCRTSRPFDARLVGRTADFQSQLRRDVSLVIFPAKREGIDEPFESRLSAAREEFAGLLQEAFALPNGTLSSQRRSISEILMRAVRCAAKQYMLLAELGDLALVDELTGLYNRRGFMAIAERQLKVGRRSGKGMLLFFIDVDDLKQINDSYGHSEGDRALRLAAQALEMTFRDSDIIARMGGDEFAVLAIEAADHSEDVIRARLCEDLKSSSAGESRYSISLSMGVARFNRRDSKPIGELIAQADKAMYEEKRRGSKPVFDPMTGNQATVHTVGT